MKYTTSIQRGFVSGIALSLLVALGIFTAVHTTSAQGNDDIWTTDDTAAVSSTSTSSSSTSIVPTAPTAPNTHTQAYIGLGDSVAAGLGLPTWKTATADDKRCGRSPESYVFEVGRQLKRPHVPYACSGATSADIFNQDWSDDSTPKTQLDQAFSQGIPAVMSITVGANDIDWSSIIKSCYAATCGTTTQTNAVNEDLVSLQANLDSMLQQIKDRSNGQPPKVILTGYYNPVSLQCVISLPGRISVNEVAWVSAGVTALNKTIEDKANTYPDFVRYAPVDFTDHDLCSLTPWIQGLSSPAPVHPTAAGQQAIAKSVVAAAKR